MPPTEPEAGRRGAGSAEDVTIEDIRSCVKFWRACKPYPDVYMSQTGMLEYLLASLDAARAEVAALRGAGADERAEAAVMGHAEAYRLVGEAREMREERDAARAEAEALREALDFARGSLAGLGSSLIPVRDGDTLRRQAREMLATLDALAARPGAAETGGVE